MYYKGVKKGKDRGVRLGGEKKTWQYDSIMFGE